MKITDPIIRKNAWCMGLILVGLALRLIWPADMEWKDDEKDMHRMALEAVANGKLPAAGMRSGGGLVNPGLSVAPFALFASFSSDPVSMNRMVQCCSVLALLGCLFFVLGVVPEGEKEIWLRGLALAAVSPLAVLFSRKIWAQDVLPLVSLFTVVSHHYRGKKWGAFLWGLFGALIGQIHMSGFFYAAGIFLYTLFYEWKRKAGTRWVFWLAGSVLGSITLLGWIVYLLGHPQISRQNVWHILQFNFFIHWFIDSTGLNIYYSLREEFWKYISMPWIKGIPLYLPLLAQLLLVVAAFPVLGWVVSKLRLYFRLMKQRTLFTRLRGDSRQFAFYLHAILLGLGVLLTLSAVLIHPHYLICAFPFQYLFIAKIFEHRPRWFIAVLVAQLLVSVTFLVYIHQNGGAPGGDYGQSYRLQF